MLPQVPMIHDNSYIYLYTIGPYLLPYLIEERFYTLHIQYYVLNISFYIISHQYQLPDTFFDFSKLPIFRNRQEPRFYAERISF